MVRQHTGLKLLHLGGGKGDTDALGLRSVIEVNLLSGHLLIERIECQKQGNV